MSFPAATFDQNEKIWTTPEIPIVYNTECALGRIIYNQMNSHPNNILQIDHSANVTLKTHEVLTMAKRIAQHFDKMQLKQDDIIGFAVKNTTYVLPTVIGCLFNCTPFHAVNPILDQPALGHCFGITKPKVIFCDSEDYNKVYLATKAYEPKIFTVSGEIEGVSKVTDLLEPTKTEVFYEPKHYITGGHQTVAILCSSGTTGKPKAVCRSGSSLILPSPFLNSNSIVFTPSGIDWGSGLSSLISSCLTGAKRVIVDKHFTTDIFIEIMKKYRITNAFLTPYHIATVAKHPQATKETFSSLVIVQSGGSLASETAIKSFRALLNDHANIIFGYGLAEFGLVAANFMTPVGKLRPGLRLRIVDDDGKNLGHNNIGEVYVNHGKYWGGYYGNPIETDRMRDSEGWFHTGDLGFMDDENYLHLVDRKKEIRKYRGHHFWPKEIEDVIIEMPGVEDVCVITIIDELRGDCSGALVVKAPNSSISEQGVTEYVKKHFADTHKQINAGVVFVNEIPRNSNGKMRRVEAKEIFETKCEHKLSC